MYAALIDVGDDALGNNQCVRAEAAELRAEARALRLRSFVTACQRYPQAADVPDVERIRRVLYDVVSHTVAIMTYAGYSRGSACHVCGYEINEDDVEFYIGAHTPELRLDAACYAGLLDLREQPDDDLNSWPPRLNRIGHSR